MTEADIREFHKCCEATFLHCPDAYAKAYAKAGLSIRGSHEIQVQCLYILNNMSRWRGDEAKWCRQAFKILSKD